MFFPPMDSKVMPGIKQDVAVLVRITHMHLIMSLFLQMQYRYLRRQRTVHPLYAGFSAL